MNKKRVRVVYFDFAIAMGGSVTVLLNTLKYLDRTKYDPVLVTALPLVEAQRIFGDLQIPIICHHHLVNYVDRWTFLSRPIFSVRWRRRLASYFFTIYAAVANIIPILILLVRIARIKPGLMHTHNGIDSMLVALILRIPVVLHLHGPFGANSDLEIALAKAAGKCICVSTGIAEMLASKGVDRKNLVVLGNPNPIPVCDMHAMRSYTEKFRQKDSSILIAHVGRLVPWKGQKEFLQAFALVARKSADVIAVIVGADIEGLNEAYVRSLRELVKKEQLQKRVFFTGQITDIQNLVAAVDVVVHSSTEPEPFGLVVTEAMALGKPVVAANIGATVDIVDDGVTGLLADPNSSSELSEAIYRLVIDEKMRHDFGVAALEKVKIEYSIEHYRKRLEEIYTEVVEEAELS